MPDIPPHKRMSEDDMITMPEDLVSLAKQLRDCADKHNTSVLIVIDLKPFAPLSHPCHTLDSHQVDVQGHNSYPYCPIIQAITNSLQAHLETDPDAKCIQLERSQHPSPLDDDGN